MAPAVLEYLDVRDQVRGLCRRGRANRPEVEALMERAVRLFEALDNDGRRDAIAAIRERGQHGAGR